MNISKNQSIGELVSQNFRTARVFREHQIDFCCGGSRILTEVCEEKGIDPEGIIASLEAASLERNPEDDKVQSLPLDRLCDHIVEVHHRFVKSAIPSLLAYLEKIAEVHGERHPELHEVFGLFRESANNLGNHMEKEEIVLFPVIRRMIHGKRVEGLAGHGNELPLLAPVEIMQAEHEAEGNRFRLLFSLTSGYRVPEDACQTYRVAMLMLNEFEQDLHRHIHLENNILFPGALEYARAL